MACATDCYDFDDGHERALAKQESAKYFRVKSAADSNLVLAAVGLAVVGVLVGGNAYLRKLADERGSRDPGPAEQFVHYAQR